MKHALLRLLVHKRRSEDFAGYSGKSTYAKIGDFRDGLYECQHVSPWAKTASNVDAEVMVVGQDWSSSEHLEGTPIAHVVQFGFDPAFPTNRNLDWLLKTHLRMQRRECYFTNLFPFIKTGDASKSVPMRHLILSARDYLIPQVETIQPRVVICLGLRTHYALMRAIGAPAFHKLGIAIDRSPFLYRQARIFAVAHTGARGMNNRGREQVEHDWARIAQFGNSCGASSASPHRCAWRSPRAAWPASGAAG